MDIKLRARLSAYSKLQSLEGLNTSIPTPTPESAGSVLGVKEDGTYTLYPSLSNEDIDSLFTD